MSRRPSQSDECDFYVRRNRCSYALTAPGVVSPAADSV
jgi:hypothetical protein